MKWKMSWNIKCHEISNVMKCQMSWNENFMKCQMLWNINCQMSWSVKIYEVSKVLKCQRLSNGKHHFMENVIKCQMFWQLLPSFEFSQFFANFGIVWLFFLSCGNFLHIFFGNFCHVLANLSNFCHVFGRGWTEPRTEISC